MTDVRAIKSAVAALAGRDVQTKTLPARDGNTPLPAVVGQGRMRLNGSAASSTSGSIAAPLTEQDYATRTWHSPQVIYSTDGIWAWSFDFPLQINLTDANGASVPLVLDAP
jgi:hypothetical protein